MKVEGREAHLRRLLVYECALLVDIPSGVHEAAANTRYRAISKRGGVLFAYSTYLILCLRNPLPCA